MADNSRLPEDMREAINKFFNGKVNVYEAGAEEHRPEYIQERPSFKVFPKGDTTYVQLPDLRMLDEDAKPNYVVTQGQPADDNLVDTESHKFFKEMEERFRDVQPDMTLFVVDPDVVRARYAMDESPDRSIGKTMFGYLQEKIARADKKELHQLRPGEEGMFAEASVIKNSPFSLTMPRGVTEDNLYGKGGVSIVIGDNPDFLDDPMFAEVPGIKERMQEENISRQDINRMILLHEFGHAMDPASSKGRVDMITAPKIDQALARHRTECVADAHSVLQMARHTGNTDVGKLTADVRVIYANSAIQQTLTEEIPLNKLEKELTDIEKEKATPKEGESKAELEARNYEKTGREFAKMDRLGMVLAYHTTPVVEAAIAFAEKGLKDGSLQKMTDKEVHDKSVELSKEFGLSREEMSKMRIDIAKDKPNKMVTAIKERAEEAKYNVPLPKKVVDAKYAENKKKGDDKRSTMIRAMMGLPVQMPQPTQEQMVEQMMKGLKVEDWFDKMVDKVAENGGTAKALLEVVNKEKEGLRKVDKKDDIAKEKLMLMNMAFLADPSQVVRNANAREAVDKTMDQIDIKFPKDMKPEEAIATFVSCELSSLKMIKGSLDMADKRTPSLMAHDQINAMAQEHQVYTQTLVSEKTGQEAAKVIVGDKKLWGQLSKVPMLSDMIKDKANGKHNPLVDAQHMLFGNNDPHLTQALRGAVDQKVAILSSMVQIQPRVQGVVQDKKPILAKQIAESAKNFSEIKGSSTLVKFFTEKGQARMDEAKTSKKDEKVVTAMLKKGKER